MDILSNGLNFLMIILGFGVLIFVHELGHFVAAKWAGIRTEAFAVGMGPVMLAWRKGLGFSAGSTDARVVAKTGKSAHELSAAELDRHGLGETEYSLRWLPIGGFVKMLGQEDANVNAVSDDPRSYTQCPVGKRMVVVSAGVVMNVLLAAVLFIVAFMVGVRFEAPVIGDVSTRLPAGTTAPLNADELGVTEIGLLPGDLVVEIDGRPTETFADVQIASAMSRPDVPIELLVDRAGVSEPLRFKFTPEKDAGSGLLSIGVAPGSSTTLRAQDDEAYLAALDQVGLGAFGIGPGMRMLSAGGVDVATHEQFQRRVARSDGQPIETIWTAVSEEGEPVGAPIVASLPVLPRFEPLIYPGGEERLQSHELGLIGFTPLVRVAEVLGRQNRGLLEVGDVVLRIGAIIGPRTAEFRRELADASGGTVDLVVWRDGSDVPVTVNVDRKGQLRIAIDLATDLPVTAQPLDRVRSSFDPDDGDELITTPAASLALLGGTRFDAVNDTTIDDWATLRGALRAHTAEAANAGTGAELELTVTHPTPRKDQETLQLVLSPDAVRRLHDLPWTTELASAYFEPIYAVRSADGNPVRAVVMGFEETHKLIVLTYLTIDRLIRGSVEVNQLRGPVGIVHLGTRIADRGFTYLIFFLAMISVNLAVINFLPLPIVDGGLFLFLIYEKFKGRPPSLAFQNAATIAGLFLIGTAFLVTFYNDVMRLIG